MKVQVNPLFIIKRNLLIFQYTLKGQIRVLENMHILGGTLMYILGGMSIKRKVNANLSK